MQLLRIIAIWVSIAHTICASGNILSPAIPRPFNFSYNITGVLNIAPTQVFDDGHKTYFQFGSHQEIPSIFLDQPSGLTLLSITKEGHLLYSIPVIGHAFVTILKNKRGYITYYGGARSPDPGAIFYPTQIDLPLKSTTPTPLITDNTTSHPLQDFHEDCLLCRPMPVIQENKQWKILLTDRTIKNMLERWSAVAGYHLVWQIDRHFPIEAESIIEGDIFTALRAIASSLARTDYPIKIFIHDSSRLIRVAPYHQ